MSIANLMGGRFYRTPSDFRYRTAAHMYIYAGVRSTTSASWAMSSSPTFASRISDDLLDKLYSTTTMAGVPGFPGPTHESTQAVLKVLRHDYKRHWPYINHLGFHKYAECFPESFTAVLNVLLSHTSHHVLTLYALGVSPELIKDVYHRVHLPKMQPILVSPGPITEENFVEHVGDEKYILCFLGVVARDCDPRRQVLRRPPRVLRRLPAKPLPN